MTRSLMPVFFGLGFGLAALGWGLAGYWAVGLGLFLAGLGLFLLRRRLEQALNLAFALNVLAAALGLWRGVELWLALGGVLSALAAWDLQGFAGRLAFAAAQDDPGRLQRVHLLQLGLILLLGVGLSLAALWLRVALSFEATLGLALLAFLGIGALVNWLGARGD